ncbi:MAG: winged helix-turn-helix domain-containing protein [Steroidobacteraceae bacterium]
MKISYVPLAKASGAVHEVVPPARSARGAAMQLSGDSCLKCPPPVASLRSRPQTAVQELGTLNGKPLEVVQIGNWLVNPALDTLCCGTETHKLEPRMMRLLLHLANAAGAVVSVDGLLSEVWTGVVVGPASVYQAVSQLRKLLGDVDPDPTYIATVPRRGYRLVAPVRRGAAEAMSLTTDVVSFAPAARRWVAMVLGGVMLLAVILTGSLIWRPSPTEWSASIAVLPFIDLTAEKAEQPFCDGLTEELSNRLSQIPTLRVVARTSALAFRGKGEDVRRIGKALDTDHILEGSVRRSGNHMRVTVQLIDARNGYHLWSVNYDRAADDAINVQEDISRSVAAHLQADFGIAPKTTNTVHSVI